ncbi:hypothetical protein RND71_010271 [Anisodus tanguticus]|uniref:Pentatricopeptide repeat-containing protein n=1 Tax=Anisodus tanguticus TaxID=243964 RepID=A0AAE1VNN5_9SOLA|nr:hypothetical protein RND71_010271 [Anisodus tanguticus]
MNFISILRQQRITSAIHQTVVISLSKRSIHSCHNFSSKISDANFTSENAESKKEERLVDQGMVETRNSLCQRIESVPVRESIGQAFESWMGDGLPIHKGDIFHTINRLRKLKFNKRALEMKADKVTPHVSTFNILLKIKANQHNIEGILKVFGDMRRAQGEPNEVSYCILATAHAVARLYTVCETHVEAIEKSATGKNWSTLDILVILYGYLGRRNDLERTWGIILELSHVRSKSYVLAIEAFGKIGDLCRAEELWSVMKSRYSLKSNEQFNSLIGVYCRHGLITKATALYKEMEKHGCKPNAITFRHLALGCLKAGLIKEAIKTLQLGMDMEASIKVKRSTPWLETTLSIIEIFADNGNVENAEKLFEELKKANYTRYTFVYNTLIKAYVKGKVYDPNFLKRMILGGARPDSETYSLLKVVDQFRT